MNLRFSPPITGITAAIGSLFGKRNAEEQEDRQVVEIDKDGNMYVNGEKIKIENEITDFPSME